MLYSLECIDLLDTSKEILKGVMSAGFLNAAETKVANQAVESVTRLLSRPAPAEPEASLTPLKTPFHWEKLIANLKAAGFSPKLPNLPNQPAPSMIGSIGSQVPSAGTSFQDKQTSSPIQHESQSIPRLNADELTMLIVHFKTLTVTQKIDLINCLRRIEEKHQHKYPKNLNDHPSRPSSPFSKKFHHSDIVSNPAAPTPRYPALLEMTGLSEEDLKSYGVHLDEIDVPNSNQRTEPPPLIPVREFEPVPEKPFRTVLIDPRLNSASYRTHCQVPHQQQKSPFPSDANQQLRHSNSTAQQNTRASRQNFGDASQWPSSSAQQLQPTNSREEILVEQHENSPDIVLIEEKEVSIEREKESFCNELLDPRRNKNLHQNMPERSPPSDLLDIPVRIPTSPVKLQSIGSSQEQLDVRMQQLANIFKPASSEFILGRQK